MSSNILIGNKAIEEGKKKGAIDGKNSVLLNPSAYNLYTQAQMDAIGSYDAGKSKGISDVTSNPANYSLYTKAQYESHSIPHELKVDVGWTDGKPSVERATATYYSKIYVDGVLKDSYTEYDNSGIRNIYNRKTDFSGPDVDYFIVGG